MPIDFRKLVPKQKNLQSWKDILMLLQQSELVSVF